MIILHITPHLGGGIGKVISGLCINDNKNNHAILCLEEPENRHFFDICINHNIKIYCKQELELALSLVDIVQIEWWHHPLIVNFMVNYLDKIKIRVVVWSHISGCNYPNIPIEFVRMADAFVFATPYSFDNPNWSKNEKIEAREKGYLVISSGNNFSKEPIQKREHEGFNVGYVGFLGYEKTNPNFVRICEKFADIPKIKFLIVGDVSKGKQFQEDVKKSRIVNKFVFKGYTKNVYSELENFDVFACLLQKEHTGASENALLEAMYTKVCPIVLKQCTEQYLVINGVTGIVCESEEDFIDSIKLLHSNPKLRKKLSENASRYVRENLSIEHTTNKMKKIYQEVIEKDKTFHEVKSFFGESPYEWFKSCYIGNPLKLSGLAKGESKGSVKQFYRYFEDDKLKFIIKENQL